MKIEQFVVKGSGACLLTETAAAAYDAFLSRKLEIYRHRFTNVYISEKEQVILVSHVCIILKNNFKHLKNKSTTDKDFMYIIHRACAPSL